MPFSPSVREPSTLIPTIDCAIPPACHKLPSNIKYEPPAGDQRSGAGCGDFSFFHSHGPAYLVPVMLFRWCRCHLKRYEVQGPRYGAAIEWAYLNRAWQRKGRLTLSFSLSLLGAIVDQLSPPALPGESAPLAPSPKLLTMVKDLHQILFNKQGLRAIVKDRLLTPQLRLQQALAYCSIWYTEHFF